MAPSRTRRRGTFGAFRRPFVTDPVFWIAALMAIAFGAIVGAVVLAMLGVPSSWVGWLPAGVAFAVAGWLAFKLLAMGMNMNRALHEPEPADPARASTLEGTGRAAGALAGRGAAALTRRRATSAAPTAATSGPAPAPVRSGPETPSAPPVPDAPGPDLPTPGPEPEPTSAPSTPETTSTPSAAGPASPSTPAAPPAPAAPSRQAPPTPPAEPRPDVTVDKAARVLGSMLGRRMGERRRDGS